MKVDGKSQCSVLSTVRRTAQCVKHEFSPQRFTTLVMAVFTSFISNFLFKSSHRQIVGYSVA